MLLKEKQIFNENECLQIIDTVKSENTKWDWEDRKYDSTSIVYDENTKWIFNKLKDFFETETNEKIKLIKEKIHFHLFVVGDYFDVHVDSRDRRIFGVGCLLNDNYEGGEFIFYNDKKTTIKKETGNSYIFDVNIKHEVTKINSGIRYSLLWFLEDKNVKIKTKTLI